MADTSTTNFGLTLPDIGGSDDSWGGKLNDNFSEIDTVLGSAMRAEETLAPLPLKAARANKALGFDVDGNPVSVTIGSDTDPSLRSDLASTGASLVAYASPLTGAVSRSIAHKVGDVVSLKDFGVTGDGSVDDAVAIRAALAAIDTSGGKAGTLVCPAGTYLIGSEIDVPPRVHIVGAGARATIFNLIGSGGFVYDSFEQGGLRDCRIGFGSSASLIGITVKTTTSSARKLFFSNLEIAGASVSGQIGIKAIATGENIVSENLYSGITIIGVDRPIVDTDTEGNHWVGLTIDAFGVSVARNAIDAQSNATYYQGRIAGTSAAGSVAYKNTGARNSAHLFVDIGNAASAINLPAGGYNFVNVARPEGLTPLGTVGAHNIVMDSDLGLSAPLRPSGPDGTINLGVLYGGTGVPSNSFGSNGDFYFRSDTPTTANQRLYIKSAGAWVGIL